ncbi:uncharacterized protein LOC106873722 isoform X1 [Octopus bimaculoides]|uniref:Cilia- and flagella-associated protein HOATZ n=1 Tax=Octopus bimaculoides TaxID=37653 RepID=A0A0L8GZF4_OCTBM|nr:uncharacterized protein LOC106873722 isoform X1 [Octopus bimaculoides]|eukprot:XP_014776684.1 PREDICTED: uncharacterized protein LOC106873722 isoform X1 [Octopus bimaculoides]
MSVGTTTAKFLDTRSLTNNQNTVFCDSDQPDVILARHFWLSVKLQPYIESCLVSNDIKQRLVTTESREHQLKRRHTDSDLLEEQQQADGSQLSIAANFFSPTSQILMLSYAIDYLPKYQVFPEKQKHKKGKSHQILPEHSVYVCTNAYFNERIKALENLNQEKFLEEFNERKKKQRERFLAQKCQRLDLQKKCGQTFCLKKLKSHENEGKSIEKKETNISQDFRRNINEFEKKQLFHRGVYSFKMSNLINYHYSFNRKIAEKEFHKLEKRSMSHS